ncbi:hypothetical protein [uncultured Sulfitobacter sp.]|uniref:hypothetical protein n=1 Tax=uncultured Sulfitobacter sp. TaxID=191468 RepID=UPI002602DF5A|nr:hypothetical protein [uncultured Sulfitobacter sp.]
MQHFDNLDIVIKPPEIALYYGGFLRHMSGQIKSGDWHSKAVSLDNLFKYTACIKRFRYNFSWEETGVYQLSMDWIAQHGSLDGYTTLEEIKHRYQQIDRLYRQINLERRIKPAWLLHPDNPVLCASDGILIHVGPDGRQFFGAGGIHRMAICHLLGLQTSPAQLGCVHPDGITSVDVMRPKQHRPLSV